MLTDESSTFVETEFHNRTIEIGLGDDLGADVWLLNMVNQCCRRKTGRVVDINALALGRVDFVGDVRHSRDDIHTELSEEPLLYDFQMEKSEKSAAETETERERRLRFENEGSVVELEFFKVGTKFLILVCFNRIHSRK